MLSTPQFSIDAKKSVTNLVRDKSCWIKLSKQAAVFGAVDLAVAVAQNVVVICGSLARVGLVVAGVAGDTGAALAILDAADSTAAAFLARIAAVAETVVPE